MVFLKKKIFRQLFGILLSGILLYAAFKNVNISLIINRLGETKLIFVLLGVLAFIISYFVRALLWKLLLKSYNEFSIYPLFKSIVIGHMGNNILPFRGGELLRIYSIQEIAPIKVSMALSSIIIERILDLVSLILMLGLLSISIELPYIIKSTIIVIFFSILMVLVVTAYYVRNNYSFNSTSCYLNLISKIKDL